jgi:hypothetical protein
VSPAAAASLFFAPGLDAGELARVALGAAGPPPADVLDFPAAGGDVARELGVPLLAGMDEVRVDLARLRLRAVAREMEVTDFAVTAVTSGADQGIVLALPRPARLAKLELRFTPQGAPAPGAPGWRLAVRTATRQGNGFTYGPPILAWPPFAPPHQETSLYGPALAGLGATDLGGGRWLLTFAGLPGSAWLLQLVFGDTPAGLAAQAFQPQVARLTTVALPRDLSVLLAGGGGAGGTGGTGGAGGEVPLWSHPDLLLPESGEQEVGFTPAAQRALAAAFAAGSGAANAAGALSVGLRFRASGGGTVAISERTFAAVYLVRPLGKQPAPLRLGGSFIRLTLAAPAGLAPAASSLGLSAKLLGRELNAGSPEPPLDPPTAGLRVDPSQAVAVAVPYLPAAGAPAPPPLASARLYLAAVADCEAVLQIRGDAAGALGPPLAPPLALQLKRDAGGWRELELPKPLAVPAGAAPLWLSLHATRGELRWFASSDPAAPTAPAGARTPLVSHDQERTWASPEPALAAVGAPLAQLFHLLADPLPAPAIRLQQGSNVLLANWLQDPVPQPAGKPREYAVAAAALPAAVHSLLAGASGDSGGAAGAGGGRAATDLLLFSRSVLDLTLTGLTLTYDPFAARPGGGA